MRNHKIYSVIFAVFLLFAFSLTAYAATPVEIERKTVNGVDYMVKTFTMEQNINIESLIEDDFDENGYSFRYVSSDKKENISESSKQVTEIKTVGTSTNNTAEIMKKFETDIHYDEDGYTGTLALDTASINTQTSGYGYRNVPISKTKEYKGLMYADPSLVPGSITENGVTLALSGIDWVVMATALAGDSLIPTEYKAIVSYSGSQSVSYVTGYTTTAKYTGTVVKQTFENVTYTITYIGAFIPVPTTEPLETTEPATTTDEDETEPEETEMEPVEKNGGMNLFKILGVIILILAILGAAAAFILLIYPKLKNRQPKNKINASVYNLVNDEYIWLGNQPLDRRQPVINLNEYDSIKTSRFGLVLDKRSSEMLFGQTITVTYGNQTQTHMVTEAADEYKFILLFNVITDEET